MKLTEKAAKDVPPDIDTERSLYYYRARYYDPAIGRFISQDPIRFGGSANFYSYTGNAPTSVLDPSGMNSTVSVGPNGIITINVAITIYGPGVTPERATAWQKNITDTWNNNPGYGTCKVNFNVQVTPDLSAKHWFTAASNPDFSPLAQNYIYVPLGMPTNPSINMPPFTGTIPAATLSFTVAHEFGHLLGLLDMNLGHGIILGDPRDIMAEGDIVSPADITAAVNRAIPNSVKDMVSSCPCN